MSVKAIAFDFDGTLINSGLDKGIHIMCAVWNAFFENNLTSYIHTDNVNIDVERMLEAYIKYPGAPRFQQLNALMNSLLHNNPVSFKEDDLSSLPGEVRKKYTSVKNSYNRTYSGLNNTAAELHWKPFPSVKGVLSELSRSFDLFIASGVTEDIIWDDLERHNFDVSLFKGVYGGNAKGGSDKADLLKKIKSYGYSEVLFTADSNRDLLYAQSAGTSFFRIKEDEDFVRLKNTLKKGVREKGKTLPDEQSPWGYSEGELVFFFEKTKEAIETLILPDSDYEYVNICNLIHS